MLLVLPVGRQQKACTEVIQQGNSPLEVRSQVIVGGRGSQLEEVVAHTAGVLAVVMRFGSVRLPLLRRSIVVLQAHQSACVMMMGNDGNHQRNDADEQ